MWSCWWSCSKWFPTAYSLRPFWCTGKCHRRFLPYTQYTLLLSYHVCALVYTLYLLARMSSPFQVQYKCIIDNTNVRASWLLFCSAYSLIKLTWLYKWIVGCTSYYQLPSVVVHSSLSFPFTPSSLFPYPSVLVIIYLSLPVCRIKLLFVGICYAYLYSLGCNVLFSSLRCLSHFQSCPSLGMWKTCFDLFIMMTHSFPFHPGTNSSCSSNTSCCWCCSSASYSERLANVSFYCSRHCSVLQHSSFCLFDWIWCKVIFRLWIFFLLDSGFLLLHIWMFFSTYFSGITLFALTPVTLKYFLFSFMKE